uniref:histidine kinase n=1 Tax=Geoglobus ahangari TaxID=113653 RepID=A0A7J3TI27_9EURY
MIDKTKLITTLYELSLLLYPRDVKEMIEEFIKNVMTRFGFSYASIEIPLAGLKMSLPKNFSNGLHKISFEKKYFKLEFGRTKEIPVEYTNILEPLMDKLDQTLEFLILSELKRKLLENNEDVIILVDKNMIVKEMNKKAVELLGDLREKPIDRMWLNENVRLNGRYFYVSVYDLGFLKGIIAKDITEKVLLEIELKEREERLRKIVEIAPFAILIYKDWKFIYANKEAEKLLGYRKEEIIGKHVLDLLPPDCHEKIKHVIHRRIRGEAVPPYDTKIVRKNGEIRHILVDGRKMKWSDGEVIIVAFVDITPQKLLEEDLSFLNSILRHDISNEITIIMNYLELYKEE